MPIPKLSVRLSSATQCGSETTSAVREVAAIRAALLSQRDLLLEELLLVLFRRCLRMSMQP
eukprot:5611599-Amphidinium_carterae.1